MSECYVFGTCSKNTCGINKMELAVYASVAVFNYGRQASLDIYKMVIVKPGQYTTAWILVKNIMLPTSIDTSKRRRKDEERW